jgi:hypothetical protein
MRVRVQILRKSPCLLHCLDVVPVLKSVGTVDRIEAGWDHPVVVVFDLWHLGTQWVDCSEAGVGQRRPGCPLWRFYAGEWSIDAVIRPLFTPAPDPGGSRWILLLSRGSCPDE